MTPEKSSGEVLLDEMLVAATAGDKYATRALLLLAECKTLQARIEELEKENRNHVERKHLDATPNDGFPLRILHADCDMRWADTTSGATPANQPLTVALNKMQDRRAVVLDKAIATLAAEKK